MVCFFAFFQVVLFSMFLSFVFAFVFVLFFFVCRGFSWALSIFLDVYSNSINFFLVFC